MKQNSLSDLSISDLYTLKQVLTSQTIAVDFPDKSDIIHNIEQELIYKTKLFYREYKSFNDRYGAVKE